MHDSEEGPPELAWHLGNTQPLATATFPLLAGMCPKPGRGGNKNKNSADTLHFSWPGNLAVLIQASCYLIVTACPFPPSTSFISIQWGRIEDYDSLVLSEVLPSKLHSIK